ncbi:TetR/AcrR family transcriptional regulator [Streptomyces celluloflavus]|uniref:TetR/AcrR family transcriptional regulator n=1 Tax=Streptomyces celluloflavus TaxID=58344 RepID=UPI0036AC409F
MATDTAGQRRTGQRPATEASVAHAPPGAGAGTPAATGASAHAVRPMRADARRNYERLLTVARTAFTEHGTDTSLEDIARRAGVGIGTLYRHFPHRTALMGAVFQGEVDALLAQARELADAPQPCAALVEWLRAIITHATTYRGLSRALMSASVDDSSGMARCSVPMREAGGALLTRAQRAGAVRPDVNIGDLMQLTNGIALAAEESPDDPELADRLLTLTLSGLKGR